MNELNDYFENKIKNSWGFRTLIDDEGFKDEFKGYMQDILLMNKLGVSSEEDEFYFWRLQHYVPDILDDIAVGGIKNRISILPKVFKEMIDNREDYDISDLLSLFCSVARAANKFGIELNSAAPKSCYINKSAYPQGYAGNHLHKTYDINKWIEVTRAVMNGVKRKNLPYDVAFAETTKDWDVMEKLNYKQWIRFYNEGVPAKYPKLAHVKEAQYMSDDGVYLPPAALLKRIEDEPEIPKEVKEEKKEDPRESIEDQRKKILSRLYAAEKLLCSLDGQNFAGEEQELMLRLLQDLKRKVQIANKISVKSSLFEDLIYRTANYLNDVKKSSKSSFFYKIAQDVDPFGGEMGDLGGMGDAGATGATGSTGGNDAAVKETKKFLEKVNVGLDNASKGKKTLDPDQLKDDPPPKPQAAPAIAPEASTAVPAPDSAEDPDGPPPPPAEDPDGPMPPPPPEEDPDGAATATASNNSDEIVVYAQDIGGISPSEIGSAENLPQEQKPKQQRPKLETDPGEATSDIVVEEGNEVVPESDDNISENSDDKIEEALENITLDHLIKRLEILVGIYKKREISRQLSILDIMMDQLGLSSYFPSLGEAMGKALESNQYISTRLEDILAKIKGSVESDDAQDWLENQRGRDKNESPETKALQQDLAQDEREEKVNKELRKQKADSTLRDNAKDDMKEDIAEKAVEELAAPAAVEKAKPIQVR